MIGHRKNLSLDIVDFVNYAHLTRPQNQQHRIKHLLSP